MKKSNFFEAHEIKKSCSYQVGVPLGRTEKRTHSFSPGFKKIPRVPDKHNKKKSPELDNKKKSPIRNNKKKVTDKKWQKKSSRRKVAEETGVNESVDFVSNFQNAFIAKAVGGKKSERCFVRNLRFSRTTFFGFFWKKSFQEFRRVLPPSRHAIKDDLLKNFQRTTFSRNKKQKFFSRKLWEISRNFRENFQVSRKILLFLVFEKPPTGFSKFFFACRKVVL